MQVVITSFKNISETGLQGVETLQKTDMLFLFYGKGNDSMSLETHKLLSTVKAKVEFIELENPKNFAVYAAYLCGQYEAKASKVFVIASPDSLDIIKSPKILVSEDLKAALTGRKPRAVSTKQAEDAAERPRSARKMKTVDEVAKASSPTESADVVEKKSAAEEKLESKKRTQKGMKIVQGEEVRLENTPKEASEGSKKKSSTQEDVEAFRTLMKEYKTEEFDSERYAMTILSQVKEAVRYNMTAPDQLEKKISEAMDMYGAADAAKKALKGKYKKMVSTVKGMG